MSNEGLTEYLYCDKHRLDSYFEQISQPVAYDKVPMWKAGLSLMGPTAEGTQARPGRPFTIHEKVQKVIGYLRANKLLDAGRLTHPHASERPFRVEVMSARRAAVPERKDVPDFPGLSLWVSAESDIHVQGNQKSGGRRIGALFLLEGFRGDDDDRRLLRFTSYSWLALLAQVVDASNPLDFNDKFGLSKMVSGLSPRFASDPIEALSRLGAIFAPERRMTALYRVRAACMAEEQDGAVTTVGYPLVVTAEGGLLDGVI